MDKNIIEQCCLYIEQANRSEMEKIEANLKLGEVVAHVISTSKYGDGAVEKLASRISEKRGKIVYPQRLYDAYRVFSTVKTIEKVKELIAATGIDITWNWLVKHATKTYKNENNTSIKKTIFESTLKKVESSLDELDSIVSDIKQADDSEKQQLAGLIIAINETAQRLQNLDLGGTQNTDSYRETKYDLKTTKDVVLYDMIATTVLDCFEKTDSVNGILLYQGEYYVPKYGVDTLELLIEKIFDLFITQSRSNIYV